MTAVPNGNGQEPGPLVAETGVAVADMLTDAGFDVLIPGRDDSVVLKITNVHRVFCDLTITSAGSVTCEYRTFDGGRTDAGQLAGFVLDLLSPGWDEGAGLRLSAPGSVSLKGAVGRALAERGMSVTLGTVLKDEEFFDADAEIVVMNPVRPERGAVGVADHGALWWACRAYVPGKRLSGLGLDEVAATVARALARTQPALAA